MDTVTIEKRFYRVVIALVLAGVLILLPFTPFANQTYAATTKAVSETVTVREYNPAPKGKEWDFDRRWFGKSNLIKLKKKSKYSYGKDFASIYPHRLFFDKLRVKAKIKKPAGSAKLYIKTKPNGKWKLVKGNSHSQTLKFDWGDTKTIWYRFGSGKAYRIVLHRWFADRSKVEKKIKKVAEQIIKPEMSEAEIVVAVVRWIRTHIEYDWGSGSNNSDPFLGITEGHGVCLQFNTAFQAFMRYVDIPVGGVGGKQGTQAHAWSVVKVDGAWYHVDATKGSMFTKDPGPNYMTAPPTGYWYHGKWHKKKIKAPNDHPDRNRLIGDPDGDGNPDN